MTASRFPDAPARIRDLPVDARGFPVPWFVAWIDGAPDFRVVGPGRFVEAVRFERCWICGQRLGAFKAFTVGPMCAVNQTSSEPAQHLECARFAATSCPFLTTPSARRREHGLPAEAQEAAGHAIKRNPGVALVWVSRSFKVFRPHAGAPGYLISFGEPTAVEWYAHGRRATRAEVAASIAGGLPQLSELAEQDGPRAIAELERRVAAVERLLPRAA